MSEPRGLLGIGMYSVSDAARLISQALENQIVGKRLRRMAFGRREMERDYAPIVNARLIVDGSHILTFLELIELMTVVALRQEGVRPATIRRTRTVLAERYGDHPFARGRFSTDGVGVYLQGDTESLEELSRTQIVFENVIKPLLRDVSYVDDRAATYSPPVTHRTVILNPARAFGAPINKQSNVPTYILNAMHESGESDQDVAEWYGVTVEGVRDAIEYESALSRAA